MSIFDVILMIFVLVNFGFFAGAFRGCLLNFKKQRKCWRFMLAMSVLTMVVILVWSGQQLHGNLALGLGVILGVLSVIAMYSSCIIVEYRFEKALFSSVFDFTAEEVLKNKIRGKILFAGEFYKAELRGMRKEYHEGEDLKVRAFFFDYDRDVVFVSPEGLYSEEDE